MSLYRAILLKPSHEKSLLQRAMILKQLFKYQDAIMDLTSIQSERLIQDKNLFYEIASCYHNLQYYHEALTFYQYQLNMTFSIAEDPSITSENTQEIKHKQLFKDSSSDLIKIDGLLTNESQHKLHQISRDQQHLMFKDGSVSSRNAHSAAQFQYLESQLSNNKSDLSLKKAEQSSINFIQPMSNLYVQKLNDFPATTSDEGNTPSNNQYNLHTTNNLNQSHSNSLTMISQQNNQHSILHQSKVELLEEQKDFIIKIIQKILSIFSLLGKEEEGGEYLGQVLQ